MPDLALELVESADNATQVKHAIADRFSAGRVHLVGDAVRVMPPTGAFGGNTAIMDGFTPAWKLAMVVSGSDAVLLEPGDAGEPMENPERPSGRPGSRAPHLPLPGLAESTVDLFGRGFAPLTGAAGDAWLEAAAKVAVTLDISLAAQRIDAIGWASTYGVHEDGAVLVRPDFHVAWRSVGAG